MSVKGLEEQKNTEICAREIFIMRSVIQRANIERYGHEINEFRRTIQEVKFKRKQNNTEY